MSLTPNLRGALYMAISMAGFSLNDAITKAVSSEMSMGQIMFVRGAFATVLVGTVAWRSGALRDVRHVLKPLIAIRVAAEAVATVCFLIALAHLPIANVSAILQALPLAVTMGAALFFKEPVGWRRWLAITAGFVGVLIIVRPGFDGFSPFSLFAFGCVVFCTVRDLATRRIDAEVPTLFVTTMTAAGVTILGALLITPFGGWTPMDMESSGLLIAAAALLVVGYQFIIIAMRTADISFVAPFRYIALLWSIALGYFIFSDVPDTAMIIGASTIVVSGLYALYRERIVGRMKPAATSTAPGMAAEGL